MRQNGGFWGKSGEFRVGNGTRIMRGYGGESGRRGELNCFGGGFSLFCCGQHKFSMCVKSATRQRVAKVRKGKLECEKRGDSWVVLEWFLMQVGGKLGGFWSFL